MTARYHRGLLTPLLLILMAISWATLGLWGRSPYARFLNHDDLHLADFRSTVSILLIVTGWLVMLTAMMLPTSLPLLEMFRRMTRRREARLSLVSLVVAGYLLVWTLFGIAAVSGDMLLHEAVDHSVWLGAHAWLIGAGVFAAAGVYQFTPLKYYCLDKCRSPLAFLMTHWRGGRDSSQAFRLGVRHGLFCLGCCWSLMLLMFAIGMGNLGWMLLLGALMAAEKNLPWGRRIGAPLGAVLLGVSLLIVASAALAQS